MLHDPDLLSVQEVRSKVEKAWAASRKFRAFSQEQVDHIVEEMAAAARGAARKLAEFAVEETGGGNAVVWSPHPRARKCSCATAEILREAAVRGGAPEDLVECVGESSIEGTSALMKHPKTGVILSTGGSGIVRAAYSSGKPAFGVGPGNVPVLVDTSADLAEAVRGVVGGKSFDYGTLCLSEQTLVSERPFRDRILAELKARKSYLCDAGPGDSLGRLLITPSLGVNPECVGQPAVRIAQMAGF